MLSRKSGHIFERRLVVKALAASGGKCPITDEDLTEEDLITVQTTDNGAHPIPATATSLPGLLSHMQKEWDSIALESHSLRQALAAAHQELAAALYKYDAATRVIARLIKERDEARSALADRGVALAAAGPATANPASNGDRKTASGAVGGDEPVNGEKDVEPMEEVAVASVEGDAGKAAKSGRRSAVLIPGEVLQQIRDKHVEMQNARLARKKSASLATAADVKGFQETAFVFVAEGEDACDVQAIQLVQDLDNESSETVAAGCGDGAIRMYSAETLSPRGCGAPRAHEGGVTCFANDRQARPKVLFSGGADGVVRGWNIDGLQSNAAGNGDAEVSGSGKKSKDQRTKKRRQSSSTATDIDPVVPIIELVNDQSEEPSPVSGLSVHPCGNIILSALESGKWRLHDTSSGQIMGAGFAGSGSERVDSCALHPDGAIFAVGLASGAVEMWDMNQMKEASKPVATMGEKDAVAGSARTIRMSENGYYMVIGGAGSTRVWDLRKLKMTHEARIGEDANGSGNCGVALDWSGTFCASSTGNGLVRLFETRKLKHLVDSGVVGDVEGDQRTTVGIAWGADASCVFASGGNGRLSRIGGAATLMES